MVREHPAVVGDDPVAMISTSRILCSPASKLEFFIDLD
jgi:hypothetical protein